MIRNLTILLCAAFLAAACSGIRAQFDDLYLVYVSGQEMVPPAPRGFSVSPAEMISLVPVSKVGFRLYADRQAYYLREEKDLLGISTLTKTNSQYAEAYGLRVDGLNREEFEILKRYQAEHPGCSLETLSNQLLLRYVT